MPSTRPQAAFEPLSPDIDIKELVKSTDNFEWVERLQCDLIEEHSLEQFDRLVLMHVIIGGRPLVIEGYQAKLDKFTFSVQWLRDNWGSKVVEARDLTAGKDVPLTIQHYLKHMSVLTNQWDKTNYKAKDRQRMYLKDIDCHDIWADKIKDHIPHGLFYLNDGIGDIGGLGAVEPELNDLGSRLGRGAAKSGDLMSSLPTEMRAENLMCYIGHEGTYTPAHREMCASLGQNLMVEASEEGTEDGQMVKPGSSVWFMTETKERDVVSEYWLSRLGHDIEIEKHFAQINAWKQAPFRVWVVEQKPGDFILIPPLAPHQVWNRGTRTMKVAWNRTTIETLEMAMNEALPKARMVCRDEQYKNKAIVFYTLQKYSKLIEAADKQKKNGAGLGKSDAKLRQLQKDFKRLLNMYTTILISESFSPEKPEKSVEMAPFESNITCSYCRCNIFNRFLTCPSCVEKLPDDEDDTYDICMDCYAMGRSCLCISKLRWVEQWPWKELTDRHDQWRRQIIEFEGEVDKNFTTPLRTKLNMLNHRRTLAQICQLELAKRPFHDIKNDVQARQDEEVHREEIDEVDVNGNVKKKKKIKRSEKYMREHGRCHVDCYWEPKWKQATCSKCDKNYCFGNLYRAYDEMPQDILANPKWKCPSCRKICGCRHCKLKPGYKQYIPKGTLLGHNTKAVADARSVESLVDFSHPNIAWIQKAGDDHEEDTLRLRRRLRQAEAAKAADPQLGDNYVNEETEIAESQALQNTATGSIPIDPALGIPVASAPLPVKDGTVINEEEDLLVENPEEPLWNLDESYENGLDEIILPAGGVMFDNDHAYDFTNAITYEYPDLAMPSQIPPTPVEGYAPTMIPGDEPNALQNGKIQIEMVERKRKRNRLDDGDRAYLYKKAKPKPKIRLRKSLVVKLAIDKEKLKSFEELSPFIQHTQQDFAGPVVVSDLQALNVSYQRFDGQNTTNTAQVEETPIEYDDEDKDFTPGRYKDRRKPIADGTFRPRTDADTTRRTTRLLTYAEPVEDNFDDRLGLELPHSKLATMEAAISKASETKRASTNSHNPKDSSATKSNPTSGHVGSAYETKSSLGHTHPKLSTSSALAAKSTSRPTIGQSHQTIQMEQPHASSSSPAKSPNQKLIVEAQANRKAKMAAIKEVSDTEPSSTSSPSSVRSLAETSDESSNLPTHRPAVSGKTPRISLPAIPSKVPGQKVTQAQTRAPQATGFSVADWGDSSDDDIFTGRGKIASHPVSGFVAVNGHRGGRGAFPAGRGRPVKRRGHSPRP